jgi:RNA polymerase sigma-70 factor (ECF subfamily)
MGDDAALRSAYEDLLRRYPPALRRLARSYVRDPIDQQDLLQEVALGLWTALPRFRGDASERTWLYRVAHNTGISFSTGRNRRARREQPEVTPDRVAPGASPETAAIDAQRRERLWAAIDELPLIDRQIVVMHLEGLSAPEIEAVTGLTSGNVAVRLTRLRRRLTALVNGEGTCTTS